QRELEIIGSRNGDRSDQHDALRLLAEGAVVAGADGIIVDVHPQPDIALCDGPQALVDDDLRELARTMEDLAGFMGRHLATQRDLAAA
ncbi:hypothetical protein AB0J28_11430, partial [Streptosporangium canum]